MSEVRRTQVLVLGGGQAGLAAGYYLRRAGLDFAILDAATAPGGAWQHYWDTLRLFSPAAYSSLPGRPMPQQAGQEYPDAAHVVAYLSEYEKRYELPVHRPVWAESVERTTAGLLTRTDQGTWHSDALILATGNWERPFVPAVPGRREFTGRQLHTYGYRNAANFAGQRVVVVGGGNSGAQIAADLHGVATVRWVTRRPVRFLPDDIDGRALFDLATRRVQGDGPRISELGDIVTVPAVRAARADGLTAHPMFDRLTSTGPAWSDGTTWDCDAVIWCTGFRPDLTALGRLGLGTRAVEDERIHLLGYGDWTGPASATLVGVGRTARAAVTEITGLLR
ncbi:ArsO family NAD(P)H-dependent flavin-containing monooxygenase [Kitasatospora sp. Root107]|uniref:ArsO family NAD(P)H-dependent flavin-containing monooxygenase n=1 Tax=Kitasatospora sp. Root107 TaxID=1736424 RepID=UPI00070C3657|nr:ArsO family NAD(P)H-dependent flavin-containing monooxygenase [Kitasatospora sp. Root107]KQV17526.1 pyridine nucleotide-disulfide oxidoreductase [Kitasatospora sp. Root107]